MELDSRCEVVTSDKSHTTKRLYPETDYRKNSILNQAYFTVYTIKSALIFLLVDIYTMHRINTFSVIFRVSVKMSEVWSLIKDTKRQMGYWGKSQMIKIRKRRCFSGRSVLRSQCMQTCWEKLYRSFFIHFFPDG